LHHQSITILPSAIILGKDKWLRTNTAPNYSYGNRLRHFFGS
jgi:hypothetical protein